tara:strand:- start:21043 stop:22050 length:1008 start_codon:yes stop_codon:yes gene_type:complete
VNKPIPIYKNGHGVYEVLEQLNNGSRELGKLTLEEQTKRAKRKTQQKQTTGIMKKLRYSEMFYSIQGEGKFVGIPSVFLRLFGCNFECAGFGQERGKPLIPRDEMPWKQLDLSNYKFVEDLPVMHIGCDSSASWAKEYMHLSTFEEASIIADKLLALTPNNSWDNDGQDIHLILTGGEPLMWQKQLPDLLNAPALKGLKNITFETNSTFPLTDEFYQCLMRKSSLDVTWSCSPKLSISGETYEDAIKPDNWDQYSSVAHSDLYLKFVVQDEEDLQEIQDIKNTYLFDYNIYLMPCGGTSEMLANTKLNIAELAMERGWKYSPRLHVDLFGNRWGT